MHQRGGRGKPLRLICLPAQLDYFLSGQPPAGSAPPPKVSRNASLLPASLRIPPEVPQTGWRPSGPGFARDLIC